jgi:hypothetical protein
LVATTGRRDSAIQMYPLKVFSNLVKLMAELNPICVSNAGEVGIQIPHFERSVQRPTIDPVLPGRPQCLARDVSAYGCVVASLTPDSLLVCYYE